MNWFDEEFYRSKDQMQWLQDQNQSNEYNINSVRHEANYHFRNTKKEYLKTKLMNL